MPAAGDVLLGKSRLPTGNTASDHLLSIDPQICVMARVDALPLTPLEAEISISVPTVYLDVCTAD